MKQEKQTTDLIECRKDVVSKLHLGDRRVAHGSHADSEACDTLLR